MDLIAKLAAGQTRGEAARSVETFVLGMEGSAWGDRMSIQREEVQVRPEEVEWTLTHDLGYCFTGTVGRRVCQHPRLWNVACSGYHKEEGQTRTVRSEGRGVV